MTKLTNLSIELGDVKDLSPVSGLTDRSEIKLFLSITIVFTLVSPDRALRSVPS